MRKLDYLASFTEPIMVDIKGNSFMSLDLVIAAVSLVLSIAFWWNAKQQAASAELTLADIKSQIIGWQNELNKTAIEMLSASPEKDYSAKAKFTESMALVGQSDSKGNLDALLKHHEEIVLGKQRLGFEAATRSSQSI
jgi:hypothetical protein